MAIRMKEFLVIEHLKQDIEEAEKALSDSIS
jgi:hypothetical protein